MISKHKRNDACKTKGGSSLIFAALALLAALVMALSIGEPVRLRVIANSDAAADQRVKLAVRDAVLLQTGELMLSAENGGAAYAALAARLPELKATVRETLAKGGFEYGATVELGVSRFPEKRYGGAVFPEGSYTALRITLGEGRGENWWCVVFPPLCLVPADENAEYRSWLADMLFSAR